MQAQYIYKKGFHKNCCIFHKICLAALKKKEELFKKDKSPTAVKIWQHT